MIFFVLLHFTLSVENVQSEPFGKYPKKQKSSKDTDSSLLLDVVETEICSSKLGSLMVLEEVEDEPEIVNTRRRNDKNQLDLILFHKFQSYLDDNLDFNKW